MGLNPEDTIVTTGATIQIDEDPASNKVQVRQAWNSVKTQAAWDALTNAQRQEIMRKVLKNYIKDKFGGLS